MEEQGRGIHEVFLWLCICLFLGSIEFSNKKAISFDLFVTIVYICSNPMPIIPYVEGSGGIHIHKKALLDALVLTIQESRKFKQLVKNKATGTPQGCFICTARSVPYCIIRERVDYIQTSAWGFRRCSFRQTGQCESLYSVERVTDWLHVFCV